ncbi:MAG: TetR/AcrR family transcriptional regulator [Actinomycetota bacterium]
MPQETWFNLPDDKRRRVFDVIVDEFIAHGYAEASLNRIATRAQVSKGSLFQYFDNKLDMWQLATSVSAERVWSACAAAVGPPETPFPERLTALVLAWMRHLRDNAVDRSLAAATIDTADPEARRFIRENTNQAYADHIGRLVADACDRGEVAPAEADRLATVIILLMRFLANAPFSADRDPILDLHTRPWPEIESAANDLVASTVRSFLIDPVDAG